MTAYLRNIPDHLKSLVFAAAVAMMMVAGSANAADAQGAANVRTIKNFLSDIRQALVSGDPKNIRSVAEKYMSEDYVQHSPVFAPGLFPPGREGYIQVMSSMGLGKPPAGAPPAASAPPVGPPKDIYFLGDGELVVWVSEIPNPDSSKASSPTFDFNMIRVVDGKLAEHWSAH